MKKIAALVVSQLFLTPFAVLAANTDPKELTTLASVLEAGGAAMKVILVLSVLAVFLFILFLFTLRSSVLYPANFLREAETAAQQGDVEALEALCQGSSSAAACIIYAGAEHVLRDPKADYVVVRDAIEDEGARQAGVLWQRIQYLMDIAMVAPMVGLLGTVLGMLESFAGMQTELGSVKALSLAQGVSKALITTAGGLIVGILATILYAVFRGRVNKLIAGLEAATNRVLRQFLGARNAK